MNQVIQGDCLEVMRGLPDNSVDAVVTDPPYGLSFMGKKWDYDVPTVEVWREVLRVLKPGGHLLSFAGTRTQHRMAVNIEDAGFDIRDMLAWVYGSGFPKSLDISKQIDKTANATRPVIGHGKTGSDGVALEAGKCHNSGSRAGIYHITAPATPEAQQWEGWGSALKPALEPITLARKPLQGTLAQNVQEHGTGGLNIAATRVTIAEGDQRGEGGRNHKPKANTAMFGGGVGSEMLSPNIGRWPANLIHSGEPEVVACFPETVSGIFTKRKTSGIWANDECDQRVAGSTGGDSGSAARFFKTCPDDDPEDAETRRLIYQGKATKRDREEGLERFEERVASIGNVDDSSGRDASNPNNNWKDSCKRRVEQGLLPTMPRANHHPTVKPTPLMQYLCRLITPPGGIILDPFTGSGSTGKAAVLEGFQFIGIEMEPEYVAIANARIAAAAARSEKATLEQRVAWLETQVQAQGAKLRKIEASQQLSIWESA